MHPNRLLRLESERFGAFWPTLDGEPLNEQVPYTDVFCNYSDLLLNIPRLMKILVSK